MKKIMIEGKEYWQQEEFDIPKIPMPIDKDILKKYKFDNNTIETCQNGQKTKNYLKTYSRT